MELKRKIPMRIAALMLFAMLFLAACSGGGDYSPKPRGFYRINFPAHSYRLYSEGCPFTFDYPKYAVITPDTKANAKPCWFNVDFRSLTVRCI
jgi:hypothetical protein